MTQSTLLIGGNGQVGKEFEKILAPGSFVSLTRAEVDLTSPEALRQIITHYQPQVIINAAAHTSVDKAETESALSYAVNATAPKIMAEEAHKIGAYLVHISTDYVFDGKSSSPYKETDTVNPVSVYGQTKLEGEKFIQQISSRYIILRTAWVYGAYGKSNFVKTMLRLGAEREEVRVVADQIGTPTWAKDIANTISSIILAGLDTQKSGIYHYTNSGAASWYDFAVAIFEEAEALNYPLQIQRVIPITTDEYPTAATRPSYSVLACTKVSSMLLTKAPHWRHSLISMLQELRLSQ
jgi:dTDP-4-dehydrorhamnose reductase